MNKYIYDEIVSKFSSVGQKIYEQTTKQAISQGFYPSPHVTHFFNSVSEKKSFLFYFFINSRWP